MSQVCREDVMGLAYLQKVTNSYEHEFEDKERDSNKESIIFVPTNGTGLGHMTRLLAVARRVRKLDKDIEIVFFTTSYAYEIIREEGFIAYYFPSRDLCLKEVMSSRWNDAIQKSITKVIEYYKPKCLVFDGTFPYLGIITGMSILEDMKKIWVKRGNNKVQDSEIIKNKEKYFDVIIEPQEAGSCNNKNDKYCYCNPIICLEKDEILDRITARRLLGIPQGAFAIYIQLGAGKINSIEDEINMIIKSVQKKYDVYIVVGESVIGQKLNIKGKNVIVIRDYPNAKYFRGFDVAFSASGYNTFHELLYFGIPSIFIPNQETQKDSQSNRAAGAVRAGAAQMLYECTEGQIQQIFELVINNREWISRNASTLIDSNGAKEVALRILNYIK